MRFGVQKSTTGITPGYQKTTFTVQHHRNVRADENFCTKMREENFQKRAKQQQSENMFNNLTGIR